MQFSSSLGHMESAFPFQAFSRQFPPPSKDRYGSYIVKDSVVGGKLEHLPYEVYSPLLCLYLTYGHGD